MEEELILSIIIPVFNVEKYLPRCFQSLENQDLTNCEIIFIDDGSPDGSGHLCEKFAIGKRNVFVIHKENGGLSDARNRGILKAKGKYCIFLDSDDALVNNVCTILIQNLENISVDIMYAQINWITSQKSLIYEKKGLIESKIYSGEEALVEELNTGTFSAMSQLGIYDREFIIANNLWFKKGILHEDEQWSPRVMLKANKLCKINIPYYNYYIRENSITMSKNTKRYYDILKTISELDLIYRKNDKLKKAGCEYLANLYMNATSHIVNSGEQFKIDKSYVWNNVHTIKNRIKCVLFSISPRRYLNFVER